MQDSINRCHEHHLTLQKEGCNFAGVQISIKIFNFLSQEHIEELEGAFDTLHEKTCEVLEKIKNKANHIV